MPFKDPEAQRAASRRYYETNRTLVKARSAARRKANRARLRAYVVEVKSSATCTDCGLYWPYYVMQFDHVRGEKEFVIGAESQRDIPLDRLKAEIAKCDVVCGNCHAIRTHERRQHLSARVVADAPL